MGIPQHDAGKLMGCTGGRFVRRGSQSRVILLDDQGNPYELDRCTILMGGWGGADEGVQKLPRVEVLDGSGKVLIAGDRVVIFHVQGNNRRPVVIGGVRPLGANDFLARLHTDTGADENALHVRLQAVTETGAAGGRIDLDAGAGAGGAAVLSLTDELAVRVGADPDAATAVQVTIGGGELEIASGGNAVPALLGLTFLQALQLWDAGMTTFLAALAGDATNPVIQAAAVTMATIHTTFAAKVSTAVGAQGAPLLSGTLRTD